MDTSTVPSAAQAYQALQSYQAPSASDVLTTAENKYGVNDLATRVQNLQTLTGNLTNAINAVDPSVTARTAGTLTTEGQRSALVSREKQPLLTDLSGENTALTQTNDQLNTARGNAKDEAATINADNQTKYQKLLDTYNIANAREAAAQAAAADKAKQDEAVREFNVSRQDALSARSSAAPSAAQTRQDAIGQVNAQLSKLTGSDGKVSQQTWAGAFNDLVAAGFKPEEVWQTFGHYINGRYANSYAGYDKNKGFGSRYTTPGKK